MADSVKIRIEGDDSGFQSTISGIASQTKAGMADVKAGIDLATAALSKFASVAQKGINYNAQIEQLQTSFEVMTGSAEKASETVERLRKMGAETPYETADLASATQLLMQYGFTADDAIEKMTMLGDIAQGNVQNMTSIATGYAQMSSAGKVNLQDIKQMINGGFNPLQEISERTGESMADLYDRISKGTMTVDEITESMKYATSEGGKFYQSMEKQSQTLNGQLSTLKDNANELLGSLTSGMSESLAGTLLPAVNEMIGQLQTAFDVSGLDGFVNKATEMLPDMLGLLSGKLESAVTAFAKWAPKGVSALMQALPGAISGATSAIPQITTALFGVASTVISDLITMLPELIPSVIEGLGNMLGSIVNGVSDILVGVFDGVEKLFHQEQTKVLGVWVDDSELAKYDFNLEVTSEVTNNTDPEQIRADVQSAVDAISEALEGVEGIDADSVAKAMISGDTTSALATAFTQHGIDLATAESIAADISSGQQAISDAIAGLGLSEEAQTKLQEMAADDSTTAADIETYLTSMGVDTTVATTAAETITTSRDSISAAIASLPADVAATAAESLVGGYTTRALLSWSLGLMGVPSETQESVLSSYDTFSSSLTGKITGIYDDLEKTLTDGVPDDPEKMANLKAQVEAWATAAHEKIAEWYQAAVEGLDTEDADYEQQILALQERRDALETAVNQSVENTQTYVDEMGGQTTSYVQEHLDELAAISEQAGILASEIDALGGKVTTQGETQYNLVRAGADTSDEVVSGAVSFAFTEFKLDEQSAEDAYNKAIADLQEKWSNKEITDEEYQAGKATAEADLTAAKQAAQDKYNEMLGEILAGIADGNGTEGILQEAAARFSMSQMLMDMLNQTNADGGTVPIELSDNIKQMLADAMGIDDPTFFDNLSDEGLRQQLYTWAQNLWGESDSLLESADTSQISALVQQMLEGGFLEGTELASADATMQDVVSAMFPDAGTLELSSTGENYTGEVASGIESNATAMATSATNTVDGAIVALKRQNYKFAEQGAAAGKAYQQAYNRYMQIKSPSRRMMESGEYTGQGLEKGLTHSMEKAKRTAQRLSGEIATSASLSQTMNVAVPNLAQEITIANEQSATPVTLDGKQIATIQGTNNRRQLAFERARTARGFGY